ncbi:hypothetical protein [Pseudomonas indica]|uniref:hypothetical protein n=1 Tax=Pseudomonas indica TaxID=137658 RepID=UPI003FD4E0E8
MNTPITCRPAQVELPTITSKNALRSELEIAIEQYLASGHSVDEVPIRTSAPAAKFGRGDFALPGSRPHRPGRRKMSAEQEAAADAELLERLLPLLGEGLSFNELRRALRCRRERLERTMNRANIPLNKGTANERKTKAAAIRGELIVEMRRKGMSAIQIAAELGINPVTVHRHCRGRV